MVMWKDSETVVDYLKFDYIIDAVTKIVGSSDKVRGIPTQISTIHDRKRTVCP